VNGQDVVFHFHGRGKGKHQQLQQHRHDQQAPAARIAQLGQQFLVDERA